MICISITPIELFFAGSARGLGKSSAHAAKTKQTRGENGRKEARRMKKCPILVMHGSLHDALTCRKGWAAATQIHGSSTSMLFFFFSRRCRVVDQEGDHPADNADKKGRGRVKMETSADYLRDSRAGRELRRA
jgi:hypothetical protein